MNDAHHKLYGFSTYLFQIFGNGWEKVTPQTGELLYKGDTVIGNDVWIGYEAVKIPGLQEGDRAIIVAKAVVVGDVSTYTIIGGNPAKCIRQRFEDDVVQALLEVA